MLVVFTASDILHQKHVTLQGLFAGAEAKSAQD
jgi:hypothetical protein